MNLLSKDVEEKMTQEIVKIFFNIQERLTAEEDVRYLRASEAATYASVSVQTIKRWVELGLPEATIGRTVLYDKRDLDKFIAKNKV